MTTHVTITHAPHFAAHPLNVYDSVTPGSIRTNERTRLFGKMNLGDLGRSNLVVAGCLVPSDSSALLQNWYARTDIIVEREFLEPWREWVNATHITLVVGASPVHQLPLSDLLGRKEGQRDWKGRITPVLKARESDPVPAVPWITLAQEVFEQHEAEHARCREILPPREWSRISGWEQAAWISSVEFVRNRLEAPLLAHVPQRQNCFVQIDTNPEKTERLLEAAPYVTDLLIWFHLEGIMCRDYGR